VHVYVIVYDGLEDRLFELSAREMNKLRLDRSNPRSIPLKMKYVPKIGFVIEISPSDARMHEHHLPPSWTFQFVCDGFLYFKSESTLSLDESIGDILSVISDVQLSVLLRVEEYILVNEIDIVDCFECIGEIDVLRGLAVCCIDFDLIRPKVVAEPILHISQGRHLLQELTVDTFVANDTHMGSSQRILVITGPNYSGVCISSLNHRPSLGICICILTIIIFCSPSPL
jgi:DNA mismatch repair protein MSH5